MKTTFIPCDLASQASVRDAAKQINDLVERIDILICNAAIMACPYEKSVDGVESQFATNHLGHFLLVNLLRGKLMGRGTRVVVVGSSAYAHGGVRFEDWNFEVSLFLHTVSWRRTGGGCRMVSGLVLTY